MVRFLKQTARSLLPGFYSKLAYFRMLFQMRRFRKKYPDCRLIFSVFTNEERKHYSQFNQDQLVYENFFEGVDDGVFCDVGGNHPLNINNTRLFEEMGWSGIAFEPLPQMEALWKKYRRASFFPIAASDRDGEVEFTMVGNDSGWEDMLSYVKETSSSDYDYETREILVRARPLRDVFSEENISEIDYMSIDVEGHELNVLRGIDFDAVRIKVLTIENNFGGVGKAKHYGDDRIRDHMLGRGYVLWGRIVSLDDIYVRSDYLQTLHTAENH